MKTGKELYFEIKKKVDELIEVEQEKMFTPLHTQRYQELKNKKDQLQDEIEKLCNKTYIDTDLVKTIKVLGGSKK